MERISINDYYLDIAKSVSVRSSCLRRKYGAVIVNNDEIISTGYNGSPRGTANCNDLGYCGREGYDHGSGYEVCRSVHAEQNAIIAASRREMLGATLYLACIKDDIEMVDIEPCDICMRMIKNAGIKTIVTRRKTICL